MSKVLPQNNLQILLAQAEENALALSDLDAVCLKFGVGPAHVLNELSVEVAEGFLSGSLTYEFCDGVMNGIVNAIFDLGMIEDLPQPAFSLYQAFDQGEWIRSNDPLGTDSGEKYTRPLVVEILRSLEDSPPLLRRP